MVMTVYEKKEADGSITLTGYRLKFYYEEKMEFGDVYAKCLTREEAVRAFEACKGLFPSISPCRLFFEKGKTGGTYSIRSRTLTLPYNHPWLTLGILAHEVSHALDHAERGTTKHDKYMYNIVRMVMEKMMSYYDEVIVGTR